jgi:WD40 repeat protein
VSLRDGHPLYTLSGNHLHEKLHFTADGARLVTVSVREDGVQSIDLWNAKTGDLLRSVLGGQGAAAGMSVHPLSDELLVAGPDSRAWDLSGPLPGWRLPAVFTGSVTFWGGDDCLFGIAPGTTDWGLLRLKPGGADVLWQGADKGSYASDISKDGNTVALARPGVRTEVLILRKTGSAVEVIRKIPTSIDPYRLRLSPNGDRLLVMERVRYPWMLLLETATGKEAGHLDLEGLTQTNDLDWLDDHRLVGLQTLCAKRGNPGAVERITVWDADTGKILHSAINPTAMNALAISPDCSRFAEAGSDKILRIRDSATLKVIQQFRVHDAGITALAWNPVHSWVATASADLSVKVWDLETGRRIAEFHGMLAAPAGMAFSPSGRLLGTLSSDEEIIRIWRVDEAVPAAR